MRDEGRGMRDEECQEKRNLRFYLQPINLFLKKEPI